MAGKTISAYTDAETSARVAHLAQLEHRKKAQIAGKALKFYVADCLTEVVESQPE